MSYLVDNNYDPSQFSSLDDISRRAFMQNMGGDSYASMYNKFDDPTKQWANSQDFGASPYQANDWMNMGASGRDLAKESMNGGQIQSMINSINSAGIPNQWGNMAQQNFEYGKTTPNYTTSQWHYNPALQGTNNGLGGQMGGGVGGLDQLSNRYNWGNYQTSNRGGRYFSPVSGNYEGLGNTKQASF